MTMVRAGLDVAKVRADFPILARDVHGHPLVYLDNAATTQKPRQVLDAIEGYYTGINANVHRGVHELSARATDAYEAARERVRAYFKARSLHEIVFTRNATEGINLVAQSFARPILAPGDEILISAMEHHSNIVPWQLVAAERGAHVVPAPVLDDGSLDLAAWTARLNERTKMVAVVHVSNSLGTVNPVEAMIRAAHVRGIPVLVDGAQAIAHLPVDFPALGADFYVCSAHKAYGPTGFGCLYGKRAHLDAMPPWHGGGDMIRTVAFEGSTWNEAPYRFEAGTPDMAGAVGFAAALDYIEAIGLDAISRHEHALLESGTALLAEVPGLRLIGTAPGKGGILSFVMDCGHAQDIGTILDQDGIAVRTGHHCTMPLMARFGVPATVRASIALYNNEQDLQQLARGLDKVRRLFA